MRQRRLPADDFADGVGDESRILFQLLPFILEAVQAIHITRHGLAGRVITADEAERMGLVNQVVPAEELMSHVMAYASDLAANCCPTSWAHMKKQVYGDWEIDADTATTNSIHMMNASVMRPDFQEGVQSYLDKRAPQFAPFTE